jgi:biopolymer transport protein ExbD
MKTKSFFLILAAIVLVIAACPYTSTVPIDQPTVKTDKKMEGKWIKSSDVTAENPNFYEIKIFNDYKYTIVNNEYSSYDSTYTKTTYIAHASKIENISFLNMQKDGTGDYYLYKFELGPDELTLFELTDNIDEKFNSSADLKAFVQKNMKLSFFYNKDETKYLKSK